MRRSIALLTLIVTGPAVSSPSLARGDGPYKVEVLKEGPPATLAAAIKATLAPSGYRITDGQGKTYAEIWLRKATPATVRPTGAAGTVLFPGLESGTLLGALRYGEDGQDYRDQPIAKGLFTLRYGLQPQNGAHLGVSPFRDYAMLVPGTKDSDPALLTGKPLDERSAEAAGTSHPAVLMLLAPAEPARADAPTMVEDKERNLWGVVLSLPLAVKDDPSPASIDLQMIVSGAAMP